MRVQVEVELADTVFSITQEDTELASHRFDVSSTAAVLTLGRAVGKVIAAFNAGSGVSLEVMVQEFQEAVLRSVRSVERDRSQVG